MRNAIGGLFLLVGMLMPVLIPAQDTIGTYLPLSISAGDYFEGDEEISKDLFKQKIMNYPDAGRHWTKRRNKIITSSIMAPIGGAFIALSKPFTLNLDLGYGSTVDLGYGSTGRKGEGDGKVIGGALLIVSGVLALDARASRNKAIDAYNANLPIQPHLEIRPTENGLGLVWVF